MALFADKYKDKVRLVEMGKSKEFLREYMEKE